MSESNEMYIAVNYIKNKVDVLEKIELLNLRSNKALFEEYKAILAADSMLNKVYKEIDGQKSQRDIAKIVNTSEMTVSKKIKILLEYGLIEIKEVGNNRTNIYKYSVAEQAFKLTRIC